MLELLSDTGLGKETHSVISQGRVEEIVTSKPRDRRLLIEEAAGLGKHRKRRRRAQLKLEHTQENLDRALDVEREARTRLRPLKRQAEAAELHERLERQVLEIRFELARAAVGAAQEQLGAAEVDVAEARAGRATVEAGLEEREPAAGARRAGARGPRPCNARYSPAGFTGRARRPSAWGYAWSRPAESARTSRDASRAPPRSSSYFSRRDAGEPGAGESAPPAGADRIAPLERQLAEIEEQHQRELAGALEGLEHERRRAAEELEAPSHGRGGRYGHTRAPRGTDRGRARRAARVRARARWRPTRGRACGRGARGGESVSAQPRRPATGRPRGGGRAAVAERSAARTPRL